MKHSHVKQILSVVLSLAMSLSCAAFAFAAEDADLVITTAAELAAFAEAVDGGDTFAGKTVALGADIDLSGVANWNPIGIEKGSNGNFGTYTETDSVFAGTFDGRMHTVKGMTITGAYTAPTNVGLFSALNKTAVVKNLLIEDANVNVTASGANNQIRAGILAGDTVSGANVNGTVAALVDSVYTSGTVYAATDAALLSASGVIARPNISCVLVNCFADVDVTAYTNSTYSAYAGGICGNSGNNVAIINCGTRGTAKAISTKSTNFAGMAGGVASMFAGKMWNVYTEMSEIVIGKQGTTTNLWIGAICAENTTSGMKSGSSGTAYPDEGSIRNFAYFKNDMVLTEQKYQDGELDSSTAVELRASGYPTNSMAYDKVFDTQENVKAVDAISADTLNANLPAVNAVLAAYGYDTAVVAAQNFVTVNGAVYPAAIGAALQARADAAAAAAVDAKIEAIGEVSLNSEAAISEARAAYDALTDTQKALVSNLEVLTAAEATLAEMKEAAADQAAADAVAAQIAAIGEVSLNSEAAISETRAAYDALTDAQKALVSNLDVLIAAEATLAELKADAAAAAEVDAKIEAIGEVTLDSESAVAEAREAYDALTDAQKALVTKADDLTAAETALAELKDAGQNDNNDDNSDSNREKTSLWQKIVELFIKIINFFKNLFKK